MGWKDRLLKKTYGAIKSVKPSVNPTGTKSLIDKYKKAVSNVKTTDDVTDKKVKAVKSILGHSKKWGGTKADEVAGAIVKGRAQKGKK